MGLGTASIKAQVRIGGNTPPNPAAALDLNAAEGTTTGTKGLALPRVTLSSNTAMLDGTTANITGMLIYNTGGTLSTGVYYWNGTNWNKVVGSPSGKIDTAMLPPVPGNNTFLIYTNGAWRSAYMSVMSTTIPTTPAGQWNYSTYLDTTRCTTPVWILPVGGAAPGGMYNFTWWYITSTNQIMFMNNSGGTVTGQQFEYFCLRRLYP